MICVTHIYTAAHTARTTCSAPATAGHQRRKKVNTLGIFRVLFVVQCMYESMNKYKQYFVRMNTLECVWRVCMFSSHIYRLLLRKTSGGYTARVIRSGSPHRRKVTCGHTGFGVLLFLDLRSEVLALISTCSSTSAVFAACTQQYDSSSTFYFVTAVSYYYFFKRRQCLSQEGFNLQCSRLRVYVRCCTLPHRLLVS